MTKKEKVLIILGITFISFNLRAPITAVGSVVGMIKEDYSLSSGMAGLITTLPLLAFAVVSPFVAKISQKLRYGETMMIGLIFILIGELIRSYTTVLGLFIGTTFLGVGIAIGNVLIPSIIKLKFPHKIGPVTSLYTSSMCLFAAIGAGVSLPLAKGLNWGWRNSLAFWFILTALTLLIWSSQLNSKRPQPVKTVPKKGTHSQSIWKSPIAWWVTLFMGTQSFIFYSLVAWLPTIIVSKGLPDSFAGAMALTFQLTAIPATLMIPILSDKFRNQRGLVLLTCFLYISGLFLLLVGQTQPTTILAVVLMALGMGGSISLSITFISLRSPSSTKASELSGMSQSAGYLLAAIGPILMGVIFDIFNSWTLPIILFGGLILFLAFFGWFAGDDRVTQE